MPINKLKALVEKSELIEKFENMKNKVDLDAFKKFSVKDRVGEFFTSEQNFRGLVDYLESNFHKHYKSFEVHKVMDEFAHIKG